MAEPDRGKVAMRLISANNPATIIVRNTHKGLMFERLFQTLLNQFSTSMIIRTREPLLNLYPPQLQRIIE